MNHRKTKEFWTGLMAGVFLWLAVGALIHFHQYHVFGKAHVYHLSAAIQIKKDDHFASPELEKVEALSMLAITCSCQTLVNKPDSQLLQFAVPPTTFSERALDGLPLRAPPTV